MVLSRLAGSGLSTLFRLDPTTTTLVGGSLALGAPGFLEDRAIESRQRNEPNNFGKFEIDPISSIIMGFGGRNADTALNRYKNKVQSSIEQDQVVSQLLADIGIEDPNKAVVQKGRTLTQERARLAPLAQQARQKTRRAEQDADFGSKANEDARSFRDIQLQMLHDNRRSELELRRDTVMGDQRLAEQRLFDARENFADKMDLYQYQVKSKADLDRYKTTAGLIQGLGALGMAFTL